LRTALGVKARLVRKALCRLSAASSGASRASANGTAPTIIDDYAHHPVEIAAVLRAARESAKGQVIAVMQPHRYTRCTICSSNSVRASTTPTLSSSRRSIPAGEQPIPGADRDALVTGLRSRGHKQAMPLDGPEKLAPLIKSLAKPATMWFASAPARSRNGPMHFQRN
jgi:UDP-N-acetylmuramate--alanine ligase